MNGNDRKPDVTRRQMLMRLGLAATAIYAAPALLQLSEARASSFSGPSNSGPSGGRRRRRRVRRARRVSSFSGPRRRPLNYGAQQQRRRLRRFVSSFSR